MLGSMTKVPWLRLARKFAVDRAVLFALLLRIWTILSGPVTVLLIATKFSPEVQGFYYTFATILALQVFVELGLGVVITQFASHEWAKLRLDEAGNIVGDDHSLSRLVSIARLALKWYGLASIIVAIGLGIGGHLFFSSSGTSSCSATAGSVHRVRPQSCEPARTASRMRERCSASICRLR